MDLRKFELFSIKILYNYCLCMILEFFFVCIFLCCFYSDGYIFFKDVYIFRIVFFMMVVINEGLCL